MKGKVEDRAKWTPRPYAAICRESTLNSPKGKRVDVENLSKGK